MSTRTVFGLLAICAAAAGLILPAAWGQEDQPVQLKLQEAPPPAAPAAATPPTGPAPKITAGEPVFDFGETWSDAKVKHTFMVRNEGDAPLTIIKVKPGCGCTIAQDYDKNIEPGQTGRIPIELNTKATRDTKKSVKINVETNDPVNPTYELTITGKVKQRFKIDPPESASFGKVRPHEKQERRMILTNQMEEPVEISLENTKISVFDAELITKEPGKVYEFVIRSNPPYQEKNNKGNFKLITNLPEKNAIEIPASLFALPLVELRPEELVISSAKDTATTEKVRVTFNAPEARQILSAKTDAPDVQVEVKEVATSAFDVVLNFPAKYLPPASTGHKLTLKTDDPQNPEVKLNIVQKVAPPATGPQTLAGQPIPDATFTLAADGSTIKTAEMKDDATLLMFYASWCGFCKKSLPKLEEMQKSYEGKPFKVMAISMDTIVAEADPQNPRAKKKEDVLQQWKDMNLTLPQALDSNKDGASKFKVASFPTMFLLGKSGKVERAYSGAGAVNDGSLKSDVDTLLSGKALPPQPVAATPPPQQQPRPALEMAGKPAPTGAFTLASDGSSMNLNSSDEVTVAFFYASWCGFCKKTLPQLSTLAQEYSGKPVRFVGITQDTIVDAPDPAKPKGKTKEQLVAQWKELNVTFPQALDPAQIGKEQLKVQSFPTMFLIDRNGKIDKAYVGGTAVGNGEMKQHIDALLKG
jgi:thiol-disulfide isomerase/thioredoxin